jgi:hypothetical protein
MRKGMLDSSRGVILDRMTVNATILVKISRSRMALQRPGNTVTFEETRIGELDLRGNCERALYFCIFVIPNITT